MKYVLDPKGVDAAAYEQFVIAQNYESYVRAAATWKAMSNADKEPFRKKARDIIHAYLKAVGYEQGW